MGAKNNISAHFFYLFFLFSFIKLRKKNLLLCKTNTIMNKKLFLLLLLYSMLFMSVIMLIISFLTEGKTSSIFLHTSIILSLLSAPLEIGGLYMGYLLLLLSRLAIYYNIPTLATSLTVMLIILITTIIIKSIINYIKSTK